uniref:ZF(C2H2)-13 zinc finger protein n=1 Tax=Phallusia mammillata TaxID=59560 RepID=A0A6F9DWW2_9ASCI|nr:ZF(C2H2)-13 zinc finger protein [Phallusia mammillata]
MDCNIKTEITQCKENEVLQYCGIKNVHIKQEILEEDADFFVKQYFQAKREFAEPITNIFAADSSTLTSRLEPDLCDDVGMTSPQSQLDGNCEIKPDDLKELKANVTDLLSFPCAQCEKSFSSLPSLRKHAHVHKRQEKKKLGSTTEKVLANTELVPEVKEEVGSSSAILEDYKLNVQVLVSTPSLSTSDFQCNLCNKIFTRKSSYQQHLYQQHSGVSHECPVCGKSFRQKGNLTKHMRVHTGEKPFRCQYCERTFSQKWSKVHHERTHTGEKPYQCQVCEKRFIQLGHLKTHQQAVHEKVKSHMCPICAATFAHSCSYKAHMRSHTGERPYQCNFCEKAFTHLISLNDHKMMHLRKSHKK